MIQSVTPFAFQEEAKDLAVGRGNALIALTMGLGKTLVAVMTIEELFDAGELDHGLVIVPASLEVPVAAGDQALHRAERSRHRRAAEDTGDALPLRPQVPLRDHQL